MASFTGRLVGKVRSLLQRSPLSIPSLCRTYILPNKCIQPLAAPVMNSLQIGKPFECDGLNLRPPLPLLTQVCGFKVKYKLRKRCRDCYIVVRNERTYVICPTHPRHKQMSMIKKPKYTWTIAHACQSKVRPW